MLGKINPNSEQFPIIRDCVASKTQSIFETYLLDFQKSNRTVDWALQRFSYGHMIYKI